MFRKDLFAVHESASRGEWSHDGQVVGNESFAWPIESSAAWLLRHGCFLYIHVVQIALLQHSSLYESTASSLHKAQKKALGKTLVGKELQKLVGDVNGQRVHDLQSEFFQIIGERRHLWVGGHDEVMCKSSSTRGKLQRKSSGYCSVGPVIPLVVQAREG